MISCTVRAVSKYHCTFNKYEFINARQRNAKVKQKRKRFFKNEYREEPELRKTKKSLTRAKLG